MSMDLSECAYYRGTGTCSFGCYDYPRCADLGPPEMLDERDEEVDSQDSGDA